MAITNAAAIHFSTEYGSDQIIGITSGTLSVTAPSGFVNKTASSNFAHGFGDSAYFAGIFSSDGGITWNDFGSMLPTIVGGNPIFQTVGCNAICDATNLTITLTSYVTNFTTGTGSAATISYKVYLLAKNSMAQPITPLATNQILQYNTAFNYQKIFMKGTTSLNVAVGNTGSISVTHGLGYIPKIRTFVVLANTIFPLSNGLITDPQARLTTTDLTFFADETSSSGITLNTTIEYRIYLDT